MSHYRYEPHNLGGTGYAPCRVYDLPSRDPYDFWASVTDVPCPSCDGGIIRWAEAGHAPGYRDCDGCGRCFVARGTVAAPTLVRDRRFDRRHR